MFYVIILTYALIIAIIVWIISTTPKFLLPKFLLLLLIAVLWLFVAASSSTTARDGDWGIWIILFAVLIVIFIFDFCARKKQKTEVKNKMDALKTKLSILADGSLTSKNKRSHAVVSPREKCEKGYATARYNLLGVIALTVLNIIMFLTGSESYFLFSATMPYQLVVIGSFLVQEGAASAVLVVTIIVAALIITAYLVCFFIGKKSVWGMIVALILFAIDSVWFLFLAVSAFDPSLIINFVFQAWVLYYLIMAVVYHFKLKAMPCEQSENSQTQQTENLVLAEDGAFAKKDIENDIEEIINIIIEKDIKDIINEVAPNINNSELRNIFTNFLNEDLEKAYKWSTNLFIIDLNLFIQDLSSIDSASIAGYCNNYIEQLQKYRQSKKELTQAEKIVLNILEGAYLSSLSSLWYYHNSFGERLLSTPIQCFQRLKLNLHHHLSSAELLIFGKIKGYYKEIIEFKDAIKTSEIMENFSDLSFYILLQCELMKIRAEKVNKFSKEHPLLKWNFDDTLKFFEENNFSKEETIDYMTTVFGNYGITSFVCENQSLKYIIDDGLSFLNLNWTFNNEISTAEKVESYFDKQRKKRYIERLSKGEKTASKTTITDIDLMSGFEFEKFVASLFQKIGYKAYTTKETGDQGIDVIAEKGDVKIAIQCKCYKRVVGNHAIMEAFAGAKYYDANKVMVVTNSTFTKSAIEIAKKNNVQLWDRKTLIEKIEDV